MGRAVADPQVGQAGVAVLDDEDSLLTGAGTLAQLAPVWCCLLNAPGWGGQRFQRAAAASIGSFPRSRLVPLPEGPWAARARAANLYTREALAEVLAVLGVVQGLGAGATAGVAASAGRG